ncbi:hypothetical protein HOA55_01435 [archaeon]|jgi:hypothetical protein|nr:hypothetical protein [archaeon]MBT3578031.1 hypothetical protein [archaeon]MBT6819996.1 hypothetical protein [archaeon]MBT6956298.1 hypothetical protein [archaeon]MBT7025033.1 hypothetical protein [archaeon]
MRIDRIHGFLDNLRLYLMEGENRGFFPNYIDNVSSGIILANENSLIDSPSISSSPPGRIASESVKLELMSGNRDVLAVMEKMEKRKDCSFFPGTFLRDFGGYYVPAMPVFLGGELVQIRIKQTSPIYVADYQELAKIFLGDRFDPDEHYGQTFYEEPTKGLMKMVKSDRDSQIVTSPVEIGGLNILPVICNEFNLISNRTPHSRLDGILHSSDSLYDSESHAIESAQVILHQMKSSGKIQTPFIYAISHIGEEANFSGKFLYDGKKLQKVD